MVEKHPHKDPAQRAKTVYGRFAQLPGKQRVLLGVIGVLFSSLGLAYSDHAAHEMLDKGGKK